jgi:hypothetical protein
MVSGTSAGGPGSATVLTFTEGNVATTIEFDGPPNDPAPLEFQLADPERLRTEFAGAGLTDIDVQTVIETTEFGNGDALWEWIVSSKPLVDSVLRPLQHTTTETAAVKHTLETMVRDRAAGSGTAKLTNPVNIGIGRK